MTSTFPTSRTSSHQLKNGIKEIQRKKEALINLEAALKKRINEFRELCLKEGELTGHLPVDYPLQPREPIPQVRRRIARSNGNIPNLLETVNSTGPTNFQSYYEETKPFQMSDFYKYSSKFRQKSASEIQQEQPQNNHHQKQHQQQLTLQKQPDMLHVPSYNQTHKTTRQLQEEISRTKNSLKFAQCDDHIQASEKLIEKSGLKLMEATARATAVNPGLAQRLNSIFPNHIERY